MSKREAFNFYRSYYDVFKLLSTQKEKAEFITALLERQFEGIEPTNLKGQVLFAYTSQQHSINKQVKGWEDKKGIKLTPLGKGGAEGGSDTPYQQEQEKEQEEEQERRKTPKVDFDFDGYLNFINKTLGKRYRVICDKTKKEIPKRLKQGYTKKQIEWAILNVKNVQIHVDNNYFHCTPEFFSREKTLQQYGQPPKNTASNTYQLID